VNAGPSDPRCEPGREIVHDDKANPEKDQSSADARNELRCHTYAPGRCERSPAHTPLRTVRESFPSHGSSLSKISLCRGDPAITLLLLIAFAIRTCSLLASCRNRSQWDFQSRCLAEDAPTDRLRSVVICFSSGRRFYGLSCKERPDRRGHIQSVTDRHWLLRSSQRRLPWARLAVSLPWNGQGGIPNGFSMFRIHHGMG
jgi:hypothetical protein